MGNKRSILALMLVILFLMSLVIIPVPDVQAIGIPTWSTQTIDENAQRGFIALDSKDNPRMVYNRFNSSTFGGSYDIVYAVLNNSTWNIQEVSSQYYALAFVLDSHDNPHILAGLYTNQQDPIKSGVLTYISWTGSNWNIQTVFPLHANQMPITLALDSNNKAHILFCSKTTLVYAVSNSTGWDLQTEFYNADRGNMAVDSKGNPHFIYLSDDSMVSNTLVYATWDGSSWNNQTLVSYANFGFGSSPTPFATCGNLGNFAVDSNDYPYIDYVANNTLTYAKWTGDSWNIQSVDSNAIAPGAIALDSKGNPHICYSRNWVGLTYATPQAISLTVAVPTELLPILVFVAVTAVLAVVIATVGIAVFRWRRRIAKQQTSQT
jgi:hypothetical protein